MKGFGIKEDGKWDGNDNDNDDVDINTEDANDDSEVNAGCDDGKNMRYFSR